MKNKRENEMEEMGIWEWEYERIWVDFSVAFVEYFV